MAFNIFERWPWTSFQNLNLDWLMKAVKEAVTTAEEAAESVGQFDARITENAADIEALQQALANVKGVFRVFVNTNLDALHDGQYITGAEIYAALQAGQLPYLEYAGESYVPETWTSAGDMRFYTIHVDQLNTATMRRILVPAQSYNCAYSIVNLGGGGASGDVFTVKITDRGDYADPQYICDHTFAEIRSQMASGSVPVFLVGNSASSPTYDACSCVVSTGEYIDIYDPPGTVLGKWRINASNNISRYNAIATFATVDTVFDNAVIFTGPQALTEEQKAQARTNIGAGTGGGTTEGAVLYNAAQTLTSQQQARARENINAGMSTVSYDQSTGELTISTGGAISVYQLNQPSIPVITNTESILQLSIDPNKFYIFPNAGQLSISFAAGMAGVVNEYHFRFTSGSTATQLDLPDTVQIPDDFDVATDTVYEISIIDNYMVYSSWAVTV